jgi:hypothetical protein
VPASLPGVEWGKQQMKTVSRVENFPEAVLRRLAVIAKSNMNKILTEISFDVGCWWNRL